MHEFPADLPAFAPELLAPLADLRRRLRAAGRPVAVICIGASGRAHVERAQPELVAEFDRAVAALPASLPQGSERAWVTQGREHLVLLEADPQSAALAADLLVESGRLLALAPGEPPTWAGVHVGLALDPSDKELFIEALVAVAQEGANVARSRGGECVVHTRLYDLLQGRLERAQGRSATPRTAATSPQSLPVLTTPIAEPQRNGSEGHRANGTAPPSEDRRADLERRLRERLEHASHGHLEAQTGFAATVFAGPPVREQADQLRAVARTLAADLIEEERRELDRSHREEVELLERRIERLLRSLEETEAELRRLALEATGDGGIPSYHRTIQGISASDAHLAAKRELMAQLLEANLELRRRIAESAA